VAEEKLAILEADAGGAQLNHRISDFAMRFRTT
jgi:hypothetical protein